MRILSIGLDRAAADRGTRTARRQIEYFAGWRADIVILATGEKADAELAPGIMAHLVGGRNKLVALVRGWRSAWKMARKHRPDAVTAQDALWCGLIAYSIAKCRGIPLHIQDHGAYFARPPFSFSEKFLAPAARLIVRGAQRVRTVGERGAAGLRRVGVSERAIDVMPIATEAGRFADIGEPGRASNVLCIARLEPEKGVDVLLKAWKTIAGKLPEARLRIVGDGSLRQTLETSAKESGIDGSVEFFGKSEDVKPHLAWASVVVQPSWFEGWGLAVVEAAAAARPVVMTDTGCAGRAVIHGVSGLVVAPGDAAGLARAVMGLLADPAVSREMGRRGRDLAQGLPTPEETVASIRRSFEACLPEAGNGRPSRPEKGVLVCVEAADPQDALMGFFVGWLRELSLHASAVVCALRMSDPPPDIPNVRFVRTKRPGSTSKLEVLRNVFSTSWRERKDYQAVFIRGNPEYAVMLGWFWKLVLRKRVVMWFTHYTSRSPWFWLSLPWVDTVLTAVPESNPLRSSLKIGHHIDTDFYRPGERHDEGQLKVLVFGRVSPVKRVPWVVENLKDRLAGGDCRLRIVGAATVPDEALALGDSAKAAGAVWENREIRDSKAALDLYHWADVVVNATPASLDKVILEAAATGAVVLAASQGVKRGLDEDLHWLVFEDGDGLRRAVARLSAMGAHERAVVGDRLRRWVIANHSLKGHIRKVVQALWPGR